MTAANFSSALKMGFKLTDKSVAKAAAIAMTKIGTRTLYYYIQPAAFTFSGTSVASAADGVAGSFTLPNANTGNAYTTFRIPTEWVSTSNVTVKIFWKSGGTTGNAKFSVLLGSKATGEAPATDDTQTVTSAAHGAANKINVSEVTFASSLFAAGDLVGINVSRDPADAADTLSADVKVLGILISLTGRG